MAISLLGIRDQVPAVPRGGRIGVSSWRADIFSDQFAACLRSCGLSRRRCNRIDPCNSQASKSMCAILRLSAILKERG
jgi:hypothetical protein